MKGIAILAMMLAVGFAQADHGIGVKEGLVPSTQASANGEWADRFNTTGWTNAYDPTTSNEDSLGVQSGAINGIDGDEGAGNARSVPLYSAVPGPAAFLMFVIGGVSLRKRRSRNR